ncbi:MAG TPA: hypothetical protein VGI74_21575 [Streptosporangiaceae bacterium]|jgi:hypothetical protein
MAINASTQADVSATLNDAELEDITGGAAPHTVCCGSDCVQ